MLNFDQFVDAGPAEIQQLSQSARAEWITFGSSLNLHELVAIGHDKVEIHIRSRIFRIIEIEHRNAFNDAHADRRHVGPNRVLAEKPRIQKLPDREIQRNKCARDRSRARSAVRLYDVAVDPDLALTQ